MKSTRQHRRRGPLDLDRHLDASAALSSASVVLPTWAGPEEGNCRELAELVLDLGSEMAMKPIYPR